MTLDVAIAFINASLAPAVIFTGVGLLLAGLQAKFSTVVLVIRQLHRERNLHEDPDQVTLLSSQIDSLMHRARLVRNSICFFYATIFFLILASLLMGFGTLGWTGLTAFVLITFGTALTCLFLGIAFAIREAVLSYHIVQIESRRWTL